MKSTFEQALQNLVTTFNSNASDEMKEHEYEMFCKCYPYYNTAKLDSLLGN